MTSTTTIKNVGRNNKMHLKSNIQYFIKDLDFEELQRKSLFIKGRNTYDYPITDLKNFQKMFVNILKRTSIIEDSYVLTSNAKKGNNKFMIGSALSKNGKNLITFLYEISVEKSRTFGKIYFIYGGDCTEKDFLAIKKYLLEFTK